MMNVEQAITHLRYKNITNKERFTEAIDVLENEISHQKAEIERLRKETSQTIESIRKLARDTIRDAKSGAIKEFAERLKSVSHPYADTQMVFELQIDNLVKEMVGE